MFGRKAKAAPKPHAAGNAEAAQVLRQLQGSGYGASKDGPTNIKEEVRALLSTAHQLDAQSEKAKLAQKYELSRTFARRANQLRQQAKDAIALHSR